MAQQLTRISAEEFDGVPAWRLRSPDGATGLIARQGGTLLSWQPEPGVEVIDGYTTAAELQAVAGKRSLISVPWVGEIDGGTYQFGGKTYQVKQTANGLLSKVEMRRVRAGDALMLAGTIKPSAAYPWKLEVSVVFALEQGLDERRHLSLTVSVKNASGEEAPVAIGWSPYVKLPEVAGISNLSLSVRARTRIAANPAGVPIPGDAALTGVSSPVVYEYIGREKLRETFTNLVPNSDGVVVTRIGDPATGSFLQLTQEPAESPFVAVSTGDSLERDARQALALAPRTAMVNAFNRPDQAVFLRLGRGERRSMTATLSYKAAR
ncbi:putative aldose-1-epimerase [Actinobaculum suis]|uniref:Putative aldose-1-epimerase n=1 Tax=Actinobaculum suis TaxID=1657 RepID=A0A7Z8Y8U6_9ACTO|nr:aldose 1-epimerase [Actinobaculum suis]VDG76338.1 putative aldose-1-epimerase [Actinobaculum suis]